MTEIDIDISEFTDIQARRLQKFLSSPGQPDNIMSYFKLTGFLFAVTCAPKPIPSSEWLPLIFDGQDAVYGSMEEAGQVLGAIMSLYNLINSQVLERQVELPRGLVVHGEALKNLEPEADLSQWSKGFMCGHDWLEELWTEYTPEELDEELGAQLFILYFFADRRLAEGFHQEMWRHKNETLAEVAGKLLPLFEECMNVYAHLGRSLQETVMEFAQREQRRSKNRKPGRNDLCPCGSGKKYKKCCEPKAHVQGDDTLH